MTDAAPLLLIEDTPSLQMVYESVLRGAGHSVRCASTAEEGLRAFRELAPQVVLLDLMLPDGDGLDLMAEMLVLCPGDQGDRHHRQRLDQQGGRGHAGGGA